MLRSMTRALHPGSRHRSQRQWLSGLLSCGQHVLRMPATHSVSAWSSTELQSDVANLLLSRRGRQVAGAAAVRFCGCVGGRCLLRARLHILVRAGPLQCQSQ